MSEIPVTLKLVAEKTERALVVSDGSINGQEIGFVDGAVEFTRSQPPRIPFPSGASLAATVNQWAPEPLTMEDINAQRALLGMPPRSAESLRSETRKLVKKTLFAVRLAQCIPKWNGLPWKQAFAASFGIAAAHYGGSDAVAGMATGGLLMGLGLARAKREKVGL